MQLATTSKTLWQQVRAWKKTFLSWEAPQKRRCRRSDLLWDRLKESRMEVVRWTRFQCTERPAFWLRNSETNTEEQIVSFKSRWMWMKARSMMWCDTTECGRPRGCGVSQEKRRCQLWYEVVLAGKDTELGLPTPTGAELIFEPERTTDMMLQVGQVLLGLFMAAWLLFDRGCDMSVPRNIRFQHKTIMKVAWRFHVFLTMKTPTGSWTRPIMRVGKRKMCHTGTFVGRLPTV